MNRQEIASAYIIRLENNDTSRSMAERCHDSCVTHGITVHYWPAFDGTGSDDSVTVPPHLVHQSFVVFPKPLNSKMAKAEIACVMSHFSLWCHCMIIDKPIIILEHDAVVVKPIKYHRGQNSINYLGNIEQWTQQSITESSHLLSIEGYSYSFMRHTHAYSVDPAMARNLVSYTIREGITRPADVMLRADQFNIYQDDIYAYEDHQDKTTIMRSQIFQEPTKTVPRPRNYNYS